MAAQSGISRIFASDIGIVTPVFNAAASGRTEQPREFSMKPVLKPNFAVSRLEAALARPRSAFQRVVTPKAPEYDGPLTFPKMMTHPAIRAKRLTNDCGLK
jgi:hypothetical protein